MAKDKPFGDGPDLSVTKRRVRVVVTNIGEGGCGDYDASDPHDKNYLRFYTERKDDAGWVEVADASYCTQIESTASRSEVRKCAAYILEQMYHAVEYEIEYGHRYISPKKIGEQLSWIAPNNYPQIKPWRKE